jgi:hypothetical protein
MPQKEISEPDPASFHKGGCYSTDARAYEMASVPSAVIGQHRGGQRFALAHLVLLCCSTAQPFYHRPSHPVKSCFDERPLNG